MVQLNQQYNVNDEYVQGGGSGPVLIPEGVYKAIIVNSEMKQTKTGGQMLVFKYVITEGQYANTEFYDRLNIINNNATAVQIAYKTLARISEACGLSKTPSDSNQLHNVPLMIEVKTRKAEPWQDNEGNMREGKDQSEIKGYKPVPQVGVAGSATAQPQADGAFPAAEQTNNNNAPF